MHVAPLRLRLGMVSVIWESLVSLRHCSREDFADNHSAQFLFIYIDEEHEGAEVFIACSGRPNVVEELRRWY